MAGGSIVATNNNVYSVHTAALSADPSTAKTYSVHSSALLSNSSSGRIYSVRISALVPAYEESTQYIPRLNHRSFTMF